MLLLCLELAVKFRLKGVRVFKLRRVPATRDFDESGVRKGGVHRFGDLWEFGIVFAANE